MKKAILLISVLLLASWFCIAQTGQVYPLKVGAEKIDITPKGLPVAPATGKYDHERDYVRVIVLDNGATRAALISLEGRLEGKDWTDTFGKIMTELGCPAENIIMSTTHTHSTNRIARPGSPFGANLPGLSPEELKIMSDKIVEAVRLAKAKLEPAVMGFGTGMSYLNVNRDAINYETRKWGQEANLDGVSDKRVHVYKFAKPSGEPIAVYMNYAMHPVNGYVLGIFTADIPGAVSRYVEKAFNDKVIVAFSQGAQGDQNPLYLRTSTNAMASRMGTEITGYELNREKAEGPLRMVGEPGAKEAKPVDTKVLDNLFRFIESQGQLLGEEVIRIMTVTTKMTGDVYIKGLEKTVVCPGRKRVDGNALDPTTREGVPGVFEERPDVSIHLGVLGLGTTAILRSDGEVFSLIGQRAKKESPLSNVMFVGLANGSGSGPGYIPNDAAYGEQVFQVLNSPFKPGCAERKMVNALVEMVDEYLR